MPVHFIHARDPEATVAVFPVDHFIPEEAAFMRHVAAAAGYAGAHPEWLVLLGAEPTEPEPDYGWIEPGECIGSTQNGPLYRVGTFWEKPPNEVARTLSRARLAVEHVRLRLERRRVDRCRSPVRSAAARPARLDWASRRHAISVLGARPGLSARAAGGLLPRGCSSRHLPALAVLRVPALAWCDLGTPERVARSRHAPNSALACRVGVAHLRDNAPARTPVGETLTPCMRSGDPAARRIR